MNLGATAVKGHFAVSAVIESDGTINHSMVYQSLNMCRSVARVVETVEINRVLSKMRLGNLEASESWDWKR